MSKYHHSTYLLCAGFWWRVLFGFLSKISKILSIFFSFIFLWRLEKILVNLATFSSSKLSFWCKYILVDYSTITLTLVLDMPVCMCFDLWALMSTSKWIGSILSSFSHRISWRRWASTCESTLETTRLCRNIRLILSAEVVQENMQSCSEIWETWYPKLRVFNSSICSNMFHILFALSYRTYPLHYSS